MKRILFYIISAFALVALVSCGSDSPIKEVIGEDGKVHELLSPNADIKNYGNGVYYFWYDCMLFPEVLSVFIATHPELEVLAISGDSAGPRGRNSGYFVVFKKKASEYYLIALANKKKN